MQRFAVIDTETTWTDKVMSIGVVIADITQAVKKRNFYLSKFPYASLSSVSVATATPPSSASHMKIYTA